MLICLDKKNIKDLVFINIRRPIFLIFNIMKNLIVAPVDNDESKHSSMPVRFGLISKVILFFLLVVSQPTVYAQDISIDPDKFHQKFIGVGGAVGNYFDRYFNLSRKDRRGLCRLLAEDLNYEFFKSYDGNKTPEEDPGYYDDRATFYNDLKKFAPDVQVHVTFMQVAKKYESEIENNTSGIYSTIAREYFDILKAYHDRNATVAQIDILNEPGGGDLARTLGRLFSRAVPKLRRLIENNSVNTTGVPMPLVVGPSTWGPAQTPKWIKIFKEEMPSAWNNIDIVSTHGYSKGWQTKLYKDINDTCEGKPFYNNEQTGKAHKGDGLYEQTEAGDLSSSLEGALSLSQIFTAGMLGGTNAFFIFQNFNHTQNNAALLEINEGTYKTKKMYFGFKQITSLQPDDSFRIDRSYKGLGGLRILTMRGKKQKVVYLHVTNIKANNVKGSFNLQKKKGYIITGIEKIVTDETRNVKTEKNRTNLDYNSYNFNVPGHSITTYKITYDDPPATKSSEVSSEIHQNQEANSIQVDNVSAQDSFQIYNLAGQKVLSGVYENSIDTAGLRTGVYFLKMNQKVFKFMKK